MDDEHPALRDRALWDSRERFVGTGDRARKVRPEIARSWQRSRQSGVRPDGDPATRHAQFDPERRLLRLARPILDRLEDEVSDTDAVVILTDARGLVLERRAGDASLRRGLDRVFLAPGHLYAEETVGTNGIGTASEDRRATWVVGSEHYVEWLRWLSCAGVPIRDPITGRVEGILDLTCRLRDTNSLMVPFVKEGARQIEQRLYEDASARDRELLERFVAVARRSRRPVVAVNYQTVISNAAAARLLAPADHMLLWNHIADAVKSGSGIVGHVRLSQGSLAAVRFAAVERGEAAQGAVLEIDLDKPDRPASGSSRRVPQPPPPADLPGRSPAWREVCSTAAEVAESRLPVLIAGEPGVGKLALARFIHWRGRTVAELTIMDAALVRVQGANRWLARAGRRLADPRGTLVLRHLEALDGDTARSLAALLAAGEESSRPRVVGTLTHGSDGAAEQGSLLSHFPAIIRLPPLRDRPEDIADIVPVLIRRHAGGPGPRCRTDLIQALIRAEWPNNVRQLESLLQVVLTRRRSGELTVQDLPPEYRNLPWRRLSPMERAERAAIRQALEYTGGNKSQAAASLGIARATLYRKLKELGISDRDAVAPP